MDGMPLKSADVSGSMGLGRRRSDRPGVGCLDVIDASGCTVAGPGGCPDFSGPAEHMTAPVTRGDPVPSGCTTGPMDQFKVRSGPCSQ